MITNQCQHCNPDQKRNCEECSIYQNRQKKEGIIMTKIIKDADEDFKDVKMTKAEMKLVLDLLFNETYKGRITCTTMEEWAMINGGLALHLWETFNI